jgi:hypothetical protein
MEEAPILQIVICFGILIMFLVYPWVRRVVSVGLPLCYILNLAMIHWLGGLIHALPSPWHSGPDPYTEAGFRQAFWGTVAFAIGSVVIAPFILRMVLKGETSPVIRNPGPDQARLPMVYLLLGMASFGILTPALKSIPSISALTVSGIYLAVVGVCLACWSAYIQQSYKKLVFWLTAICVLPLVTIVTLGFVGYGAGAALLVFTFVVTYYRPHWQAAVGLGLLIFLGLSLFVTYFRDRPTIRRTVWGGAAFSDRIETLASTLTNFEFIDLQNPRHLDAIDSRLNQNYLVGRVVKTIDSGQADFANGGTLYEALLALVPRIMWPGKPVVAGSGNTVSRYTRLSFDSTTSIGIGQVMEFYINFGTLGVVAGFLIIGVLVRIGDTMAALHLYEGNWQGFMSWFMPSMSLLNVGGSLVEVFGTVGASVVLVLAVNKLLSATQVTSSDARTGILAKQPSR